MKKVALIDQFKEEWIELYNNGKVETPANLHDNRNQ